jgi:hypothetical protein
MHGISNARYNLDKRGYRTTEWRLMYSYEAFYTRRKSLAQLLSWWVLCESVYLICLHIHLSEMQVYRWRTCRRPLEVLLPHRSGTLSKFPFPTPSMGWESQKHGLALWENENISGALEYQFIYWYRMFYGVFFPQSDKTPSQVLLLPVSPLSFYYQKFESPLHSYPSFSKAKPPTPPPPLPYGDWSDNLFAGWPNYKTEFNEIFSGREPRQDVVCRRFGD